MWENPEPNFMDQFEFHYQPAFTYKALNRLIQGSVMDMTKGYGRFIQKRYTASHTNTR